MARAAEAYGWDGVFVWDDICIGPQEVFDPWVALGAMSVQTERITLGSMVFSLARRRPWKVARETLTVDNLSGGRLVVPVGFGGDWDGGYARVNTDRPERKLRREKLDECLDILALAWSGQSFDYSGKHYQATDLVFRPRPVQQPRIPIWTVGAWPHEQSLARSARWDGIIAVDMAPDGAPMETIAAPRVAEIRAWLSRRRTIDDFDIVVEGVTDGADPSAVHTRLEPYREAGATWWIESRWGDEVTADSLLERIAQGPPTAAGRRSRDGPARCHRPARGVGDPDAITSASHAE
ncbi:Flavin-dependent oxidoreductase, luciferase family (includes alkanesulfonate monooxygenase SsuD and methylene tetrahydromethanopterin reductase) [Microlunatus soli]|uniref:Flavin-dependent oxidoreductase, luciferase family (Includes alkanesulfonate monooxygenase SsuD and methylene tetrahydromethanopterin reductase) n=2 Tax=Microlunatus soli TaxID=630515 RepID=A0A1H1VC21_9ACTN|nr:Flavin-dependent oxidoreductase, luciferase family (includes alkanesulfonate monooxygenase SsuD and methylene tetrahydromethanopterin reductase) [Microlunatus soli]